MIIEFTIPAYKDKEWFYIVRKTDRNGAIFSNVYHSNNFETIFAMYEETKKDYERELWIKTHIQEKDR